MRKLTLVLLVACLYSPSQLRAEYNITLTGNDLFALCSGTDIQTMKPHPTAEWQCLGYISGVADLYGKLRTFHTIKDDRFIADFCLPTGGARGGILIETVRKYLSGISPQQRAKDGAASFVLLALQHSYPCTSR